MFAVTIEPMNTIFSLSERPQEDTLGRHRQNSIGVCS